MEVSLALRSAYFQALSGNVKIKNTPIPVFDAYAIPEQPQYPYILLSSQTERQKGLKRCKAYEVTLLVDIVTGSTDPIGRQLSEEIAWEIEQIVYPDANSDLDLSSNGYEIGHTIREQSFDQVSKNNVYYIFRKLIRYRHSVSPKK